MVPIRPIVPSRRIFRCACGGTCPRCETGLEIGDPNGALEREAEAVADSVMRMPAGQARAFEKLQVQSKGAGSNGTSNGEAPGIVQDVLNSPGEPLDEESRSFMEPRFGTDFGEVRVHRGARAAEAARAVNALAYTVGRDIVLGANAVEADSAASRHLLAHELAHVAQQRVAGGAAAAASTIESEADTAADRVSAGGNFSVARRASAQTPYFARVRIRGGREFEVGDVTLNRQASTDVRTHRNLLAGTDQGHILVHGNKLGYEVSHTTPEDPFRWNLLKNIVDNEHLDIKAIGSTDLFPTHEVRPPNPPVVRRISLLLLQAGGITLQTLTRQQAARPGLAVYATSTNATRGQIYYDSTSSGRGLFGTNSLAHELFGHYALGMQGAMSGHRQSIGATPAITDPFGRPYVGTVNDYISGFAGSESGVFESPTQFVGRAFLAQAMTDLAANGGTGLTRSGNNWATSPAFDRIWLILSQNYRALGFARVPPPAPSTTPARTTTTPTTTLPTTLPSTPTPTTAPTGTTQPPRTAPATTTATTSALPTRAQIKSAATTWFATLTADQQWVFRQYLSAIIGQFPRTRPTELATAVEVALPRVSTPAPNLPIP